MKWNEIEEIVEALEEKYPGFDILSVRYTLLKKMICDLSSFEDSIDKCNEKKLEAVQAEWIEYRNENN